MQHIAMILATSYTIDPRVDKEARDLAAAGFEVTVFAWDRTAQLPLHEQRDGFHIRRFAVPASVGAGAQQIPALLRFYRQVWRALRSGDFTALHCHDLETLPLGVVASRRLHLPLVFDAHEPSYYADARRLRTLMRATAVALESLLVPLADRVLVTNDYQLRRYARMGARQVGLVANWPENWLAEDAAPSVDHPPTLARLGSLYFDMGIEELVAAHQQLRREFPNLRLLLAGVVTPPYDRALHALLRDTVGVELRGAYRYADLPALYAEVDVVVLPQHATPWFRHITPTKFYEALARGVPVVTSDIGGLGTLVRAHGCGAVLERVSADEIVQRVRPYLIDPARRQSDGDAGRALVCTTLHWNRSRAVLQDTYRNLLGPHTTERATRRAA